MVRVKVSDQIEATIAGAEGNGPRFRDLIIYVGQFQKWELVFSFHVWFILKCTVDYSYK